MSKRWISLTIAGVIATTGGVLTYRDQPAVKQSIAQHKAEKAAKKAEDAKLRAQLNQTLNAAKASNRAGSTTPNTDPVSVYKGYEKQYDSFRKSSVSALNAARTRAKELQQDLVAGKVFSMDYDKEEPAVSKEGGVTPPNMVLKKDGNENVLYLKGYFPLAKLNSNGFAYGRSGGDYSAQFVITKDGVREDSSEFTKYFIDRGSYLGDLAADSYKALASGYTDYRASTLKRATSFVAKNDSVDSIAEKLGGSVEDKKTSDDGLKSETLVVTNKDYDGSNDSSSILDTIDYGLFDGDKSLSENVQVTIRIVEVAKGDYIITSNGFDLARNGNNEKLSFGGVSNKVKGGKVVSTGKDTAFDFLNKPNAEMGKEIVEAIGLKG